MRIHKHLKHWLVPHRHNDHRPHLIRAHGLVVMAALILGVQVSAYAMQPAALRVLHGGHVLDYASGSITPIELFQLTNQERVAYGVPPLQLNAALNKSAQLKAQNMFDGDYWNHESPACIQPWYWFTLSGYNYTYAGENLAKDFDTSAGVMQGWMNSPGHKANILDPNYTDVGFAVENGVLPIGPAVTPPCTPEGAQDNGQTTLVVAHYGATANSTVAASTPVAPTPTPAPSVQKPAVAAAETPAASPSPTPKATPLPTIKPLAPVVKGLVSPATAAPAAESYSLFKPLSLVRTLSWSTLVTIGLLLILLLVYLVTHLTVWRKGLSRWRSVHYRLFAATQVSGLIVAIILLAVSGFGKVS
jgi:hypothetical protein